MTGIQQTVTEALRDLARKVEEGAYGRDDDFDDAAFCEDLSDIEPLSQ